MEEEWKLASKLGGFRWMKMWEKVGGRRRKKGKEKKRDLFAVFAILGDKNVTSRMLPWQGFESLFGE